MSINQLGSFVSSAALGNSKEVGIGVVTAFTGFVATNYLGGWDKSLEVLIWMMIIDYVTGLLGAFKSKTVNSDVMFWGGIRKGVVLLVLALAVMCDQWIGGDGALRILAIYFYAGREGLSVVENLGKIGVPLPPAIAKFLEQLQAKGEQKQ